MNGAQTIMNAPPTRIVGEDSAVVDGVLYAAFRNGDLYPTLSKLYSPPTDRLE